MVPIAPCLALSIQGCTSGVLISGHSTAAAHCSLRGWLSNRETNFTFFWIWTLRVLKLLTVIRHNQTVVRDYLIFTLNNHNHCYCLHFFFHRKDCKMLPIASLLGTQSFRVGFWVLYHQMIPTPPLVDGPNVEDKFHICWDCDDHLDFDYSDPEAKVL